MRGLGQFAEQIAPVEELRAVLQRELAGIVGHDAAGVDDDAFHRGALPIVAPPGDVVLHGVDLGDVGLSPAIRAQVPRLGGA